MPSISDALKTLRSHTSEAGGMHAGSGRVRTSDLNDPPVTASQVADIVSISSSDIPVGPFQITNVFQVDGEDVYREDKTVKTNGKY